MTNETTTAGPQPRFHTTDQYVRANMRGTGSAIRFELHPATRDETGSVFVSLALQKTLPSRQGPDVVYPTFDWENRIIVKLGRGDLAQILQVLRGMQESINDGKGLFHRSDKGNAVIKFFHQIDPSPCYMFSVSKQSLAGTLQNAYYVFGVDEAFSLMLCLEQAMMYICFGIPEVIARPAKPQSDGQPSSTSPTPVVLSPEIPAEPPAAEYRAVSGDPF